MANIDYLVLAILLFIFLIILIKRLFWLLGNNKYKNIERLICAYSDKPLVFEAFVADLYKAKGYEAELTTGSRDGGKDIIMYKGRHKYAVEVKLYKRDHKIDREKIQKLHSAMIDIDADRGIFVTTSEFTEPAIDYADKYNIETVDGIDLQRMIKTLGIRI